MISTGAVTNDLASLATAASAVAAACDSKPAQEKPIKMNTYIQLEIDQSDFNCLPRVCKFCVQKLILNESVSASSSSAAASSSIANQANNGNNSSMVHTAILAFKLQGSKRSFRTVEIPMHKTQPQQQQQSQSDSTAKSSGLLTSVDLNLNYNITYPHFIKKDNNVLYFYIQRKKKYKAKTILGIYILSF